MSEIFFYHKQINYIFLSHNRVWFYLFKHIFYKIQNLNEILMRVNYKSLNKFFVNQNKFSLQTTKI